ncbi:hypothetical protein [Pontiella sp.]|uniref:hypothetical protein n=1 Tax=Pontiella sp. TaxID=2837462 RepID=UPI003565CF44
MKTGTLNRPILALALLASVTGFADFSISFNFGAGIEESRKTAFYDAAAFWEAHLTGYRYNDPSLNGIVIQAEIAAYDGSGGALGYGAPAAAQFFENITLDGASSAANVAYSTEGYMLFDSEDIDSLIAGGSWETLVRHEVAHALGFGYGWNFETNGITYNEVYALDSGQYTGAGALAAYQSEFDADATFVPVEMSDQIHWDEVDEGIALTGIVDSQGRDMRYELMTGWLNTQEPSFVSNTTLGQFYDLGYTVIPEPSSIGMLALCGVCMHFIRSRFLV